MSRPSRARASSGFMPSTAAETSSWNISGTISARPPKLTTTTISTPIRPMFFSKGVWFAMTVPRTRSADSRFGKRFEHRLVGFLRRQRAPDVPRHHQHSDEEHEAAADAHDVIRMRRLQRFDERVGQRAVLVERAPHQALHEAGN